MNLVFATKNKNKLNEVQAMLPNSIKLISLEDIGCFEEIPETESTIEGNAILKARYISEKYNCDVFADDTGLEVYALNGAPGVYSARYAGSDKNDSSNISLLLQHLKGIIDRKAQFKTIFALSLQGKIFTFEGIIHGSITTETKGKNGFGYDSIFQPLGYTQTFAEISTEEKNKISHRRKATEQLVSFLKKKL